jgi:hypothetical protein
MASVAVGLFPVILKSTLADGRSITAFDGGASQGSLRIGLFWWPVAFAPGLKTIADADHLRNKILGAFEDCERTVDPTAHVNASFGSRLTCNANTIGSIS